jgi:hypothetical protein
LRRPSASVAIVLGVIGFATAVVHGNRARNWNDELAIDPPIAAEPPHVDDPHTPRVAHRVVLVVIDGLGAGESKLPFLDELRARGVATTARVPYPTISRPNYVTILTGVPPEDSGVRANKVARPVAVDTIMDRARAVGLRVASASDYGSLASLFLRNTKTLRVEMRENGARMEPEPPVSWPFDDVRRPQSLDDLGPIIIELETGDAALVAILVLDVDRAGHASGVGDAYRAAAAAVDRMLRTAIGAVDLSKDAVIITADHGHVSPGGHGGDEEEVSVVPLVMAGAGVIPGATSATARLVDIAPTACALLGIPAPGHAEGRTLTELIALSPDAAGRRAAADDARIRAIDAIAEVARVSSFDPLRLVAVLVAAIIAVVVIARLRRHDVVAFPAGVAPTIATASLAMIVISFALVAITRGRMSPSYIPSLSRVEMLGAIGVVTGVVLQLIATRRITRPASLAAANGVAITCLVLAHGVLGLVRAWYSPPHMIVPSPFWMVMVPTLELAVATAGLATVLGLVMGAWSVRRADSASDRSTMPSAG